MFQMEWLAENYEVPSEDGVLYPAHVLREEIVNQFSSNQVNFRMSDLKFGELVTEAFIELEKKNFYPK